MVKEPTSCPERWQAPQLTQASILACTRALVTDWKRQGRCLPGSGLAQRLPRATEGQAGIADGAGVPWWAARQLAAAPRVI